MLGHIADFTAWPILTLRRWRSNGFVDLEKLFD